MLIFGAFYKSLPPHGGIKLREARVPSIFFLICVSLLHYHKTSIQDLSQAWLSRWRLLICLVLSFRSGLSISSELASDAVWLSTLSLVSPVWFGSSELTRANVIWSQEHCSQLKNEDARYRSADCSLVLEVDTPGTRVGPKHKHIIIGP